MQTISIEELRVRLRMAKKMYPMKQIEKQMHTGRYDLYRFMNNLPQRKDNRLGKRRLMRLAKICLDIETGALRWNGQPRDKSRVWEDEPIRPPAVVHRVMFQKSGKGYEENVSLNLGIRPSNDTMPSFANLFGGKQAFLLPKSLKASK